MAVAEQASNRWMAARDRQQRAASRHAAERVRSVATRADGCGFGCGFGFGCHDARGDRFYAKRPAMLEGRRGEARREPPPPSPSPRPATLMLTPAAPPAAGGVAQSMWRSPGGAVQVAQSRWRRPRGAVRVARASGGCGAAAIAATECATLAAGVGLRRSVRHSYAVAAEDRRRQRPFSTLCPRLAVRTRRRRHRRAVPPVGTIRDARRLLSIAFFSNAAADGALVRRRQPTPKPGDNDGNDDDDGEPRSRDNQASSACRVPPYDDHRRTCRGSARFDGCSRARIGVHPVGGRSTASRQTAGVGRGLPRVGAAHRDRDSATAIARAELPGRLPVDLVDPPADPAPECRFPAEPTPWWMGMAVARDGAMAPPPSLPAWPWPETRGGAVSRCTRVLRRRGGVLLIVVAVVLLIDRLAWSAIPRMSTSAVASPPSSSPPPPPSRPPLPPPAREADDPVPTLIALRRLLTDVSRSTAAAAAASRRDPGRARAEARQIVDRSVVPALEAFVFHAKRNRAAQQHDAVDRRAHAAIVSAATAPGVAPPDAAAAHIVTAALPPAPPSRLPSVPPSVPPSAVVAPPSPPQRKTASGAGTVGTVARPPKRASDDGVASGDDRDAVRDDDAMAWPGPGLLRSAHDAVDRLESVYVRTHPYRPGARLDTVMQLDADGVPLLRATTGAGRSEAAADGTGGSNVGHVGDDAAAPAADDPDDAVFRLVDSRYNAYVLSQRADPTTMMDDPVLLHDVLRLLLASWVGTIAARALGMPSVCGQLVAGSALGALGAVHSLVQVETVCRGLGNVFFMVLLGAELDAGYPRRRGRWRRAAAALAIAFAGLFVVVAGITRTLHLTSAASEALLITACAVLSSGNLIRSALPHFATAHPVHRWIADLIALQDIALALVVAATPIIAQAGHHAAADAATATSGTSGALPPSSAWHSLAALATTTPSAAHGRLALVLYALRSAVYLLLVLAAAPYVVPAYARLLARWHADEPWRRVPVATGPADAAPALNAPACVRRPALWSFSSASSSSSLASLASLGSAASSASTVDADSMLAGPPDRATDGHNGAAAAVSLARGGSTTAATAHELSILSATGLIAGLALLGAGLGVGSPELAGVLAGAVLRAHAPRPAADPDTSPPTVPGAPGADDAFLPLRSLLGGLFFVTMGLHVPPSFLFHQLGPLAVLAAGMMAAKMAAMATAMHVVHGASAAASAVAVAVAATGAAPPSIDGGRSHSNAHHHGHDKCHGHSNDESNRHGDGDDPLYSAWGVGLTLGHTSEYALILGAHAKQHRWISREIFLLVVGTTVLTLLAWPVVWRVRGAVWQRVRVRRAGKADAPAWATCPATIRRGAWQA